MAVVKTIIEILDHGLNKIAEIRQPYPLDQQDNVLQYSKELSDFGQAKFRVSSFDPIWQQFGDILLPHRYHVRLRRGNTVVWQGAIVENLKRTKDYTEVIAATYLFYLGKKLVHRTSPDTNGTANIYRIFKSGTMADAVTAVINETIADYAGVHLLANMTVGTIENPDYAPNMTDGNNNPLKGIWQFSDTLQLQFDFHTVLYVLQQFGIYSYADFEITNNLVFNFKKFIGSNKRYDVAFVWGKQGNAIDYNISRFGQRVYNKLTGIATDPNGVILHYDQSDQESIQTYGLMEGVAAYSDVKSQNILNTRTAAELPFIKDPEATADSIVLNERGYPLGVYDVGDIVTVKIDNPRAAVSYDQTRRVVGVTVLVHSTGREITTVQTNKPLDWQFGTS